MGKHPVEIVGHDLRDLAYDIENLRYDKLSEFLSNLADALADRATKDLEANRPQLSGCLFDAAGRVMDAVQGIDRAWSICEKYEE